MIKPRDISNKTYGSPINYQNDGNYGILPTGVDVWNGFPFKQGDKFPTEEIKYRATISYTGKLLCDSNFNNVADNILMVIPELDPMYGTQIREIIMNCPILRNARDAWISLLCGEPPVIDIKNESVETLLDESNLLEIHKNEVGSRCVDVISAYIIDSDSEGPTITPIESKNLSCYVDRESYTKIAVNLVHNIYYVDGKGYIEFTEYHRDGRIIQNTYRYSNGTIGKYLSSKHKESKAYDGNFAVSPVVVFKHNVVSSLEVYGMSEFECWSTSALAVIRALQNILRLGERTREQMRLVPESAVRKNGITGESVFYNKGTISYAGGKEQAPEVGYRSPDIKMEEAIKVFDYAVKQFSNDSKLGPIFTNITGIPSSMSGEAIRQVLLPVAAEARRVATEMINPMKDIIIRIGLLAGIELNRSDINISLSDGLPKDESRVISDTLNMYNGKLISLEGAIKNINRITARQARKLANEIREENGMPLKEEMSDSIIGSNLYSSDASITAHKNNGTGLGNTVGIGSEPIPDYMMPVIPKNNS